MSLLPPTYTAGCRADSLGWGWGFRVEIGFGSEHKGYKETKMCVYICGAFNGVGEKRSKTIMHFSSRAFFQSPSHHHRVGFRSGILLVRAGMWLGFTVRVGVGV